MPFDQFAGRGRLDAAPSSERRPGLAALTDPAGYEASDDLARAVNVALALEMPLLLTGEPGTGKTQLAYRVAAELGLGEPLRFDTKSSSQAQDLFLSFDSMRYFAQSQVHAAQQRALPEARDFVRYAALGEAILRTHARDAVADLLPSGFPAYAPGRSLVLIDEVDKAPRDFPNDLLNQIENLEFAIPELGRARLRADAAHRPVVIITSNSEKQLPDPFLRRCVYHHIEFPDETRVDAIVGGRLRDLPLGAPAFDGAKRFFFTLREPAAGLVKKPSTSELLDWLLALSRAGLAPDRPFGEQRDVATACLGTLAKTEPDVTRARALLPR